MGNLLLPDLLPLTIIFAMNATNSNIETPPNHDIWDNVVVSPLCPLWKLSWCMDKNLRAYARHNHVVSALAQQIKDQSLFLFNVVQYH